MEARNAWDDLPLTSLGLSIRALRTAECRGATTVGELCGLTAEEVLDARGFAETALREIEAKLAKHGLRLRTTEEAARKDRRHIPRVSHPKNKLLLSLAALELSAKATERLESAGVITMGCSGSP